VNIWGAIKIICDQTRQEGRVVLGVWGRGATGLVGLASPPIWAVRCEVVWFVADIAASVLVDCSSFDG
jgi:hypothetical protein